MLVWVLPAEFVLDVLDDMPACGLHAVGQSVCEVQRARLRRVLVSLLLSTGKTVHLPGLFFRCLQHFQLLGRARRAGESICNSNSAYQGA
jgi:hypothetical protein